MLPAFNTQSGPQTRHGVSVLAAARVRTYLLATIERISSPDRRPPNGSAVWRIIASSGSPHPGSDTAPSSRFRGHCDLNEPEYQSPFDGSANDPRFNVAGEGEAGPSAAAWDDVAA